MAMSPGTPGPPRNPDRPADEARARERKLDETLDETFPASDPPANTVATGSKIEPASPRPDVTDHRDANRFELTVDGHTAFLDYERRPDALVLVHTEVPEQLRGRHLADALARAGLAQAHAEGLRVVAVCPFVRAYLRRHPIPRV